MLVLCTEILKQKLSVQILHHYVTFSFYLLYQKANGFCFKEKKLFIGQAVKKQKPSGQSKLTVGWKQSSGGTGEKLLLL